MSKKSEKKKEKCESATTLNPLRYILCTNHFKLEQDNKKGDCCGAFRHASASSSVCSRARKIRVDYAFIHHC